MCRPISASICRKLHNIVDSFISKNFHDRVTYSCLLNKGDCIEHALSRPTGHGSIHAEVHLFQKFFNRRNDISVNYANRRKSVKYDIFVFRLAPGGYCGNSKPCRDCTASINSSKLIDRVYYSTGNSDTPFICEKTGELQNDKPSLHQLIIDNINGKPRSIPPKDSILRFQSTRYLSIKHFEGGSWNNTFNKLVAQTSLMMKAQWFSKTTSEETLQMNLEV